MPDGQSLLDETLESIHTEIPELKLMLEDMKKVPAVYQPTHFWIHCLKEIVDDLEKSGHHTFKTHPSALKYYVKSCADMLYLAQKGAVESICQNLSQVKGTIFEDIQVDLGLDKAYKASVDGCARYEADYRVFRASDIEGEEPIIEDVSESAYGTPAEVFNVDGYSYSPTMLKYLRMVTFLKKYGTPKNVQNVMEIGAGYGVLGEIFLKAKPEKYFYLNVDIPPLAHVSSEYLKKVFGADQVAGYAETRDLDSIDIDNLKKKYRAVVICPWQLPLVKGQFELCVNSTSFQEMEPEVLENYAIHIDRLVSHYLLLRNARYGKTLAKTEKDIGVKNRILKEDYLKVFDKFGLIKSDSRTFGFCHKKFNADLMLLERKA
ncbi:MAG: putative sugar O-methyltransferase [Chlamydiales bacterium]|jgi:putative sugar O-methyltransferase